MCRNVKVGEVKLIQRAGANLDIDCKIHKDPNGEGLYYSLRVDARRKVSCGDLRQ